MRWLALLLLAGCSTTGPLLVPVDCEQEYERPDEQFISVKYIPAYEIQEYCPTSIYGCTYTNESHSAFTIYLVDFLSVWRHETDHVYCGPQHKENT